MNSTKHLYVAEFAILIYFCTLNFHSFLCESFKWLYFIAKWQIYCLSGNSDMLSSVDLIEKDREGICWPVVYKLLMKCFFHDEHNWKRKDSPLNWCFLMLKTKRNFNYTSNGVDFHLGPFSHCVSITEWNPWPRNQHSLKCTTLLLKPSANKVEVEDDHKKEQNENTKKKTKIRYKWKKLKRSLCFCLLSLHQWRW